MRWSSPTPWMVGLLATLGLEGGSVAADKGREAPALAAKLFQTNTVWNVQLTFTPEQWAAIEPTPPPGGPGGPRGPGPAMFLVPSMMKDGDLDLSGSLSKEELQALASQWFTRWDEAKRGALDAEQLGKGLGAFHDLPPMPPLGGDSERHGGMSAMMGITFPYVHAVLDFEGQRLEDVGVRYKGNFTYQMSRNQLKRSLKVDLDHYVKGQSFAAETTLNLHSGVTDASWMNEVLTYQLYRDAGVPASRTAYARVSITVPGKYDHQYVGLYSLVEDVDRAYLQARFGTTEGALFKPTTHALFTDLGDDWKAYKRIYDPKGSITSAQSARLMEFCKFVSHAPDAEFAAKLEQYLDVEALARYLAVTVEVSTLDSLLMMGQNFYVYLDPKTQKFSLLPWDLDHSFGQFPMVDSKVQAELSITKPWQGENLFLARVFQVEKFKRLYLARLKELNKGLFKPERLSQQVDELAKVLRPFVQAESAEKLARFDRAVAGELNDPLPMNPGGPPGGPPGGFPGGPPPMAFGKIRPIKAFARERSRSVAEQLTGKSQGLSLEHSGPGGFDPSRRLGSSLMNALDVNKDGELSRDEFVQGLGTWFDAWGPKDGVLTREQLAQGLNKTLAPAPLPPPPPPGP